MTGSHYCIGFYLDNLVSMPKNQLPGEDARSLRKINLFTTNYGRIESNAYIVDDACNQCSGLM